MSIVVAERTLFALAPDGGEQEVVLRVFIPELQPGGEWGGGSFLGRSSIEDASHLWS